ncbi:MAG: calcium/sodium antiporter [Myxococcota bacterium]
MLVLKLLIGLVLLVIGAELLVRGASKLALAAGIPPLVVGLTVVAFGTSAPELAVTLGGATSGAAGVSSGNVIGSNIFNILVILGLSALITPLAVHRDVVRYQIPMLIGFSGLMYAFAWNGSIARWEGIVLAAFAIGYVVFTVWQGRRDVAVAEMPADIGIEPPEHPPGESVGALVIGLNVLLIAAGLAMLVFGADWLVTGAVAIAGRLGLSDFVVGVTIVAAGTSLPEVATSIMAGLRGERDIAVGNAIGSNIFNILVVLGFTTSLVPSGLEVDKAALALDLPLMFGAALLLFPIAFTDREISRLEGALFLAAYGGYVAFVIMGAGG